MGGRFLNGILAGAVFGAAILLALSLISPPPPREGAPPVSAPEVADTATEAPAQSGTQPEELPEAPAQGQGGQGQEAGIPPPLVEGTEAEGQGAGAPPPHSGLLDPPGMIHPSGMEAGPDLLPLPPLAAIPGEGPAPALPGPPLAEGTPAPAAQPAQPPDLATVTAPAALVPGLIEGDTAPPGAPGGESPAAGSRGAAAPAEVPSEEAPRAESDPGDAPAALAGESQAGTAGEAEAPEASPEAAPSETPPEVTAPEAAIPETPSEIPETPSEITAPEATTETPAEVTVPQEGATEPEATETTATETTATETPSEVEEEAVTPEVPSEAAMPDTLPGAEGEAAATEDAAPEDALPESRPEAVAPGVESPEAAMPEEPQPPEVRRIIPGEGASTLPSTPPLIAPDPAVSEGGTGLPSADDEAGTVQPDAAPDPLNGYAAPFDNLGGKPVLSIILIDSGDAAIDRAALAALPFPVTFALDPLDPAAPGHAAIYRAGGKEVAMLATGFPKGAQASDVEVALAAMELALPEAVAVMDLPERRFQADRPLASLVVPAVAASGRGLLSWNEGLNAAEQVAEREGAPAAVIFRNLDAEGEGAPAIARYLDRAVFKAAQEGAVIVAGHTRPETVAALLEWSIGARAALVALAPASAILRQGNGG